MNTFEKYQRRAIKLVEKLQEDITSGKKRIYENYGQKEIRKFIDKELITGVLTYQEVCEIKDILYKVKDIC
jgi:dsDNA-specific endonuclease/ATPase MutS2